MRATGPTRSWRDYSGGWKSKVANWKAFGGSCKPYTGPKLDLMVAACDAADGSHWALQSWSRLWKNYGGDSAPTELYISHWTGDIGSLQIQTDWGYHGKHEHLWGTFTFHGKPVFGNSWTLTGVPTDAWVATSTSTTAGRPLVPRELVPDPQGDGRLLLPVRHAGRPGARRRGAGLPRHGDRPGVSPLVRTSFAPPPPYSEATDAQANAEQRAAYGADDLKRCVIN